MLAELAHKQLPHGGRSPQDCHWLPSLRGILQAVGFAIYTNQFVSGISTGKLGPKASDMDHILVRRSVQ